MIQLENISEGVLRVLVEEGLDVSFLYSFGSALDGEKFDRLGPGRSDIDLLAVVKNLPPFGTLVGKLSDFIPYQPCWSFQNRFGRPPGPVGDWDQGRAIDFLIASSHWAEITRWKGVIFEMDAYAVALLCGKELFRK